MGGRALKNTFTRRYERKEFEAIQLEIYPKLEKFFPELGMPLYFKNKESFGDIDIVVATGPEFPYQMKDVIEELFHPNEIFHNGNTWSFDYKELQVDLITVDPIHFQSNLMYLSYNDLGNFIGRLAHQFGLKYGQEGLWYPYYFKGSKIGNIPISKDYKKIYEFLGLDFSKWVDGFDELEDIFQFIAGSKYFDWRIFQLDTLNHINKERNLKRTSYMTFLGWIDENAKDKEYEFQPKESYLPSIIEKFPESDLTTQIRKLEYEHCRDLYVKSKFNGGEIMEKYGFKGKELGDAITQFKEYVTSKFHMSFSNWVLNSEITVIYSEFDIFISNKNSNSI